MGTKIPLAFALVLASAAVSPRIGNAARALTVNLAQRLTPAEEPFLQSRMASCHRLLTEDAKNITPHDRTLLESYVSETKARMIRALTHRNRDGLTPETLGAMETLPPTTTDQTAVSKASTATSNAMRIGDESEATSMCAPASMSVCPPSAKARMASFAVAWSLPTSAMTSLVVIPNEWPWTGTVILRPIPPPHVLFANRPEIALGNVSPTDLVADFDSVRDQGYPDTEIGGMSHRASQWERIATAEASVAAAAAEIPASPVALTHSTVPDTGIPSWVQPTAHSLLVADAYQRDELRESGQVGLDCIP